MSLIKIIDEQTKKCEVALNEKPDEKAVAYFKSIGFVDGDFEVGYNGIPYLKGYAPEKPQEIKEQEVRAIRNQYLEQTDKYMIADYPITDDERELYRQYRVYLRDYTLSENWWESEPLKFDEWNKPKEPDQSVAQEEAGN